jgi:hypothetical protein
MQHQLNMKTYLNHDVDTEWTVIQFVIALGKEE